MPDSSEDEGEVAIAREGRPFDEPVTASLGSASLHAEMRKVLDDVGLRTRGHLTSLWRLMFVVRPGIGKGISMCFFRVEWTDGQGTFPAECIS